MTFNGFSDYCRALRRVSQPRERARQRRRSRQTPPLATVERLESRALLSAINGTVFSDRDADGGRDFGESGVADVTVYLDLDGDGALDAGEATAVTNADGFYQFNDVAAGEYVIRTVVPERFQQSPTIGSFYSIDVTNRRLMKIDGGVVTAIDLIPPAGRTKPALHGLALTNDGELFALEANLSPYDALWKIDAATGGLTYIGSTGQSHAWGMCYDPATDTIYGVAYIDFRVRLGTIDQQTGVFTAVPTGNGVPSSGGLGALTGTGGIAFDTVHRRIIAYDFHDGELYSFALDGTAVKLSQTNAALSGSLAFDGKRFVMERRDDATLIALDPDAGTWSVIAQHDTVFFEEALEFVPGSADYLRVLVQVDQTVTASDIGLVPPTAAIRGTVWDDADADGVRDAGEGTLSGVTVYLDLNANGKYDQGPGTTAALNPAQFPNGTVLTDALPGATLTALSPTGGPFDSVKAYTGYFAHRISYGTEATFWGGSFPVLRIDFADPVDSFTIDARGYSSGPSGWLRAYDVDGNLIATFISGPLSNTSLSTLKVSAPGIAYVLASGTGTPSPYVLFGKMTASTLADEPSTTTAADGSYAFDGLEAGTYHVGQIAPAGYYRTTNGNDRDVYYGTAYVPGTNGEMKLVTVDAVTGQITWIGDPLPQRIYGLVRANSGDLYGTTFANDSLYAIDPATGRMRLIGNTGWQITGGLAYDPQTDTLYTLGKPTANDTVNRLLVIDRTTGTVTPIGDGIAGLTGTSSLAFDAGSRRIIALDNADGEFYEFRLDGTARYLATGPNVRSYVMSQSDDGFMLQPLATGNGFFSEVDPDTAALGSQLALSESALFESLDWNFDRFRYTVELDGFDVEDITFGHSDMNTAPVVPPQSFTVDEDTIWSGEIAATDAEGQPLTFQVMSGPTHGRLTLTGDGNFLYTPDRNYHGSDAFTVRAFDGLVWSDTATISISVSPVNDLPVAITQAWATDEDAMLDGRVYSRDLDGDPVTFERVSGPTHGTLTLNADGTFVYTPAANYFGTDSFVFRAFDGQGYSSPATQSITVRSVNDAPVGIADTYTTVEDTPLTIAAATTLDFTGTMTSDPGDYIGAGGSYSLSDESGQVTVYFGQNRNNVGLSWRNPTDVSDHWRFDFAAAPGEELAVGTYTGVARYPFNDAGEPGLSVTGQHRGSNTLTGEFTVWKLQWAADGSLEEFEVSFEQHSEGFEPALRGHLHYVAGHENRGVLANDSDVEGDPITAVLVSGPANGSVMLNPDGSFTYTPNANFTGTDSFIYVASDGTASSEPVTVMIEVTPVNDPPFAGDASFLGDEDAALIGKLEGVDVDGDVLMYVLEQLPLHGELTLNADGTFAYQPEANYHGADSFTYRVFDGTTPSTAATVSLDLRPVNDAPVVTGGAFTVRDNATVGTIAGSVSAVDVDGDSLTYAIVAGDPEGYFAIDETGVITVARGGIDYQATPVFSLSVLVSDGHGSSTMAAVTIDVRAITASIDIKPGDSSNSLHNKRDNVFSIAILSSFELDASQIDIGSLTFGATGDEASLVVRKNGSYKYSYRDVNGDGLVDLVVDFELKKAELPSGTSTATLKGRLLDGTDFEAFDEVAVN